MRATFFWSALSTIVSVSRWRLRLVAFEVRMWRLKACPRLNLPVPVFLKRFAAPLCVFSLGIAVFLVYNKRVSTRDGGADLTVRRFTLLWCDSNATANYILFPMTILILFGVSG